MSTPRIPNQKSQYKKLNERLSKYMASVLAIYDSLNKEAAKIALSTDYDGTGEFSFDDYPITKDRVKKLQEQFVSDLGALIYSGTSDEWKRSNQLQDMIADKVLGKYVGTHDGKEFEHYYQKNGPALKAFQQRKEKGLKLSDKIWNQSEDYKHELEETLSVSIEKGMDAVTLSKRISKYLIYFPRMQADYEEKFGHASTAKNCEYRSIRLARSEINMAYRKAEQERWKQFDFVLGYEIKLSGSHPKRDVCDDLVGKYPKDFEFLGFHPNCLCYCVPILKTDDEYFADDDVKSPNEVTDVPKNFKEWATGNWNRIAAAEKRGTLPYFLRDNKEYYQKELSVQKAARLRHKNRDAKAIQAAWDNRTYLRSYTLSEKSLYNYEDYIDVVKQGKYFGVSTKELEEYVLYAKDIKAEEYAKLIESANEKIRERQHKSETDNNPFASEAYNIERKSNAKFAENGEEADGYLRDNAAKIWNGLTDEQKKSLYEYTLDSTDINKQLRGLAEDEPSITNLIEHITQSIDKSTYDFDMFVRREDSIAGFCNRYGIDISQLKEMALKGDFSELIGKEATELAFLSTTDNKFKFSNQIDVTIYVPRGTKCIYCEPFSYYGYDVNGCGVINDGNGKDWNGVSKQSEFGAEAELLIQRGTRMKVVSIKYENSVYYVEVDVVGQIKQQKNNFS